MPQVDEASRLVLEFGQFPVRRAVPASACAGSDEASRLVTNEAGCLVHLGQQRLGAARMTLPWCRRPHWLAVIDGPSRAVFVAGMFIIIGGDGREYGPATADQLRSWIGAGRANLETRAKAAGSEEWRRLGDFPEFGGAEAPPPVLPAFAPASAPAGGFTVAPVVAAELAGIGARTGAALVNAFCYFLSLMPGSMAMSAQLLEQNPQLAQGGIPKLDELDLTGMAESVAWVWAGLLAVIVLQALLIAVRGQNLGKMLFGLRVVRADTGEPAGAMRAVLLRFLLPVALILVLNGIPMLGFLFLFVDYLFLFREDRRCLHDLLAGTKVVKG